MFPSVDGDDRHARSNTGILERHSLHAIGDLALLVQVSTDRVPLDRVLAVALARLQEIRFLIGIDELPSAVLNAAQWSVFDELIQAGTQESTPIVRRHLVQSA